MPLTTSQRHVIDCITSINETGRLPSPSAYSTVTILADGAGFTYGKHQSTDKSGSLDAILFRYIDKGGELADKILEQMPNLKSNLSVQEDPKNPSIWAQEFMTLLAEAGQDPVMQAAQDEVFEEFYWQPAERKCQVMGLTSALAHLIVYDTCVNSGLGMVEVHRKRFPESPPVRGGDEHVWVKAYMNTRREWFANYTSPNAGKQRAVRAGVKRQDALMGLIQAENWDLETPIRFRGVRIK